MGQHRYKPADVELALERYRELTGDRTARLKKIGTENIAIYNIDGSQHLEGFRAYGARSAFDQLDLFCRGFELGRSLAACEAQEA